MHCDLYFGPSFSHQREVGSISHSRVGHIRLDLVWMFPCTYGLIYVSIFFKAGLLGLSYDMLMAVYSSFSFFSPVVSLAGFSSCASCFLFWPSLRVFHTLRISIFFFLYSNHFCLIINFLLSMRRIYKHDVLNDWMRDYFPHHPLHSVSSSFCRITSKLALDSFWDNLFLICLTRLIQLTLNVLLAFLALQQHGQTRRS